MSRPIIGVTTSVARGYLMWRCIQLGIWLAGGRAHRLTSVKEEGAFACRAYVISGGVDIDPALYGQTNTTSHDVEPARDLIELKIIQHALAQNKPLMGICRGMQMINVHLGGTLHQEVSEVYQDFLPTTNLFGKTFSRRIVHVSHQGIVHAIFKKSTLAVNSIHHQAIAKLGSGLIVSVKDTHGIAQAIECQQGNKLFGVQWHPELMLYQKNQRQLFRWLVEAAEES